MTNSTMTRQEQKELTRNGLIKTATKLFVKNGIANTATADIAKAQKVSHGTVFVHFPTREDLIMAVIEEFGIKLSQEFGHGLVQTNLKALLEYHLDVLADYEDFYHRLLSELVFLPEKIKSTVFMMNAAVSWKLYEAAAPLIENKELKKLSRSELFNTWMALVQYHILYRDMLSIKKPILKAKKAELVTHFLKLIQTEEK